MAEISNNLIAGLLLVAIVVSIVGLVNTINLIPVIQYTGFATTGAGKANLSIESQVSITLVRNESLFGSGYNNDDGLLTLQTNKTNPEGNRGTSTGWFNNGSEGNGTDYGSGTGQVYPFVVENDGTDDTTCIKVYAAQAATGWIGGTTDTPSFKAMAYNNESAWGSTQYAGTGFPDSCIGTLTEAWSSEMTTSSGTALTMCTQLNNSDKTDEIRIHFKLEIPRDTTFGGKETTVTVTAADNC